VFPAFAAVALLVAGPQRETFDTVQLPKLIGLLVLGAVMLWRAAPRELDAVDLCALGVAGAALASGVAAYSPALAIRPVVTVLGAVALFIGVRGDRRPWLPALVLAVVVAALLGLVEAAGLAHWSLHGRAPSSLFGQRNALAAVLVLGMVLSWALVEERWAWLASALLLGAMVCVTRSRGAWLAAAVCIVVAVAFRRPRLIVGAAASVAGFALAVLSPPAAGWIAEHPYSDSLARLVDSSSGSGAGRLLQWHHALELFYKHPLLGVGPGNWPAAAPLVTPGGAHGHFINSDAVATLTERGLLGTLSVAVFVVMVMVRGRRSPAVVLVLVAAAVTGAFDSVTQLAPACLVVAVVCGSALERGPTRWRWPARVPPAAAALLVLLAVGCAAAFASRMLSSADAIPFERLELALKLDPFDTDTRLVLADAYVRAGRCADAEPHLSAAARLSPFDRRVAELSRHCGR
jgi:hypothetical protein